MIRVTTASLNYSSYIKMSDLQGFMASALLYADDVLLCLVSCMIVDCSVLSEINRNP